MSRDEVATQLKDLLVERFSVPREKLQPQSHLFDDLGLDSMDLLGAIAILEERYDVEIPDDELTEMLVLDKCVDRITQHLASA
ncbi:hypothetical protein ALI22I_00725 [Saccharothrix sp. ALI-22-I]|uniref:acyl carrier protein n=1 Tax=Saccharothrix sp. ALI-22-I TaxID=1933778 RepID=UPI00097C78B4|nr:acyl carrier protein [Saccharothrix sp. ALI-22-I]ONI92990.1 hypothetical protein ALI22I_00725 [Saccharothrix sp. ALI-22-I]